MSHVQEDGAATGRRTFWLGTSWKMTKGIQESQDYVRALDSWGTWGPGLEVFVLPSATALAATVAARGPGSRIRVGAQNAHWESSGPFTGEVSVAQVADAGGEMVEIGHSERRRMFSETDEQVALKVRRVLDAGLTPLVCVGETGPIRSLGGEVQYVLGQVFQALSLLVPDEHELVLVAYEPVWAIGDDGRPASADEIRPVLGALREQFPRLRALLYGGGVGPDNMEQILEVPSVQGLFVGRSAWDVRRFKELVAVVDRIATSGRTVGDPASVPSNPREADRERDT